MAHQTHQPKFKASQGYCLDCGADHSGFTCDQFCTMRAKALREQAAHASTTAAEPQDGTKVQGYRKLGDKEIALMNSFKETSRYFIASLEQYRDELHAQTVERGSKQEQERNEAMRWLSIARTDMQTACMAACRAVAKPEDDC